MKDLIISVTLGLLIGGLFAAIKLPLPAPTSYIAIAGIIGITTGYKVVEFLIFKYF